VRTAVLLPLFIYFGAVVARCDVPALSGKTSASAEVFTKVREALSGFAPIFIHCAHVDAIAMGPVPSRFDPKQLSQLPTTLAPMVPLPRNPRYELWTISGCGHSAGIVVELWIADTGKVMFALNSLSAPF
jgi:hypothetical protein